VHEQEQKRNNKSGFPQDKKIIGQALADIVRFPPVKAAKYAKVTKLIITLD